MDDKVIIGGKEYPVKVNFNSVAAFLKAKGTDSLEAFADFGKIPLSDYPLSWPAVSTRARDRRSSPPRRWDLPRIRSGRFPTR